MVRQRTETTHPHGTTRNTPVIQRGKKKRGQMGRGRGGDGETGRADALPRTPPQNAFLAARKPRRCKRKQGATEGETRSETKSRLRPLLPTHTDRDGSLWSGMLTLSQGPENHHAEDQKKRDDDEELLVHKGRRRLRRRPPPLVSAGKGATLFAKRRWCSPAHESPAG
ncbi:hypothetical protein HPB51_009106 [Rhipicephalus microplus]|uniref:Uncharacterized protein n=1 Tax=Rhipicephalus microplus TaxID=6941 RepID=A0A9J6EZG6_RHIMP|nr:hypothetical protein HPB51_009106 [Rhipicephalus microplus]